MSNATDIATRTQPRDIAADWVVRINDPEVTGAELVEWQAWLAEDPGHCELYQRLDHVWARSTRVSGELAPVRRQALPWRLAASVFVLVSGGIAAWWVLQAQPTVIETVTAEQRSLRLDDGSRVELAAESVLSVDLNADRRSVNLKRGEAYFDVAPDIARPFVVIVGHHQVRALGTAFNIERSADRTVVTVTNGVVQLSGSGSALRLRAGEQGVIDAGGMRRTTTATVNPQAAVAWRQGRFEYLHEELRYVLADVNRYAKRKIVLDDPRLARLEFTGTVFVDNLDEWLMTLEGSFPLRVVERGDVRKLIRQSGSP